MRLGIYGRKERLPLPPPNKEKEEEGKGHDWKAYHVRRRGKL